MQAGDDVCVGHEDRHLGPFRQQAKRARCAERLVFVDVVHAGANPFTVTFSLTGFNTARREGIELTTGFTANVNADLKVGDLQETITVSASTPVVDIQNVVQQRVMTRDVLDTIPTAKVYNALATLLPGTIASNVSGGGGAIGDIGGVYGDRQVQVAIHGSKTTDQKLQLNGMSFVGAENSQTPLQPNDGMIQEIQVEVGAQSTETESGGVRLNIIPKEGGNDFKGLVFASFANESMSSSNYTDALKNAGFLTPNAIKKVADVNPAFGGPIMRDKLWFFGSYRMQVADNYVGGMFFDNTYNDPNIHTLNLDTSHRISNDGLWNEGNARVTWQANAKNKFGFSFAKEHMCTCPSAIRATTSPGFDNHWGWPHHMATAEWTSTLARYAGRSPTAASTSAVVGATGRGHDDSSHPWAHSEPSGCARTYSPIRRRQSSSDVAGLRSRPEWRDNEREPTGSPSAI